MKLTNIEIADFVYQSFLIAFNEKDTAKLKNDNPFRSSYFVSLIGEKLENHYSKSAKTNYQHINSLEERKKSTGEWLFDISVTSQMEIIDTRHSDGKSMINTNILLACESEFETSLSAFTTDFGKLICSGANQYMFIQGLNQSTEAGRKEFINFRKEIIQNQLRHLIRDDFLLAFIPTPGKIGNNSFWNTHEENILDWAEFWIYNVAENIFYQHYPKKEL
jgi:hypothetical protein